MAGNMILNNLYQNVTYNVTGNTGTLNHGGYNLPLFMNSNMREFAMYANNLQLNLDTFNVNYSLVTDMGWAFYGCSNLTGNPVCSDNVTSMCQTYVYCNNLTGNPVCGTNVVNLQRTYTACSNLTGSPVCGNSVTDMYYTYLECPKLTGSPVCGSNVTNFSRTYYNCRNLSGAPVCGNNVTSMRGTYESCPNLYGNFYMNSNNVEIVSDMLTGHNASNIINIFVVNATTTNTSLYSQGVGCGDWTLDTANNRYYNAANNIYVYYNWRGVTVPVRLDKFIINRSAATYNVVYDL